MSQSGKLMPNLDQNSTKILNLTVLQRMDPYIEEILITAAHVTFYEFNVDLNQWSRKDVEGSLFVVKRNTQPRFQFIVMNRRNTENLVENLLGDFEFELQVPYLLYRNASQEVNGIWFYNTRECEDVANLFTRILGAYSKVPSKQKVNKSEFEELEAVPTSAVIEGPLEPGLTASRTTDVPEDSSFVNFFSTAMNLGLNNNNTPNPVSSIQPYHNSTTIPLSSREVPSPVVNTPPLQIPSSYTSLPQHDSVDQVNSTNHVTNLIKPLSFFTPSSSSSSSAPLVRQPSAPVPVSTLQPPLNVQRSVGIPLLQPFPPPTPPVSLTPTAASGPLHGPLTREKVREAFVMLAQDNQFIDMFYNALLKVHQS
ncbi:putative mRNA-decapping enzyme subunit 1, PH-like domain superfamily [Helianthus annuus]|nr:putative mRNA-decapping enzyme subunit 1, PH-like domain superfamily [Helianthus annuus]